MAPADTARRRFVLACTAVVVGCAAAAIVGVERPRALAVGGLVAVLAGLVLVIGAEEPLHEALLDEPADRMPEPEPPPILPEPEPTPILPEPEPEPEPTPILPEPEPETEPRIVPDVVLVTFRLPSSVGAERVHLVGEFNDWSPARTPMARVDDWFQVDVPLRAGQAYRYRFLLDGQRWENDWAADTYLPNGFGTEDSVIVVPARTPQAT